jgi:hypothetical protein
LVLIVFFPDDLDLLLSSIPNVRRVVRSSSLARLAASATARASHSTRCIGGWNDPQNAPPLDVTSFER